MTKKVIRHNPRLIKENKHFQGRIKTTIEDYGMLPGMHHLLKRSQKNL